MAGCIFEEEMYQFAVQQDDLPLRSCTVLLLSSLLPEISIRLMGWRGSGLEDEEDEEDTVVVLGLTGANGFAKLDGRGVLNGTFADSKIFVPKHAPD